MFKWFHISHRDSVFVCWCVENLIVPNAPHLFSFYKMQTLRVWYIFLVTFYKLQILKTIAVYAVAVLPGFYHQTLLADNASLRKQNRCEIFTQKKSSLQERLIAYVAEFVFHLSRTFSMRLLRHGLCYWKAQINRLE